MRPTASDPASESEPREDPARAPLLQAAWREVETALDEELNQLPDKYRAPLVLCYLQGKTHEEAAALLNCQAGSMSWLIGKGRKLLRKRLAKRGIALSLVLLLLGTSQRVRAATALVDRTVAAACTGAAAADVLALAEEEESRGGRAWLALALLALVLVVGAGLALVAGVLPEREPPPPRMPSALDLEPPAAGGSPSARGCKS